MKIIRILFAQYAAGVFVSNPEAKSLQGIVVGYFIDFGLSSLLGIIFVFSVKERPLLDVVLMTFIHLIYGLVLGLFVQKFGRKALEVA